MIFSSKKGHSPDYIFMAAIAILVIFGLAVLASASSDLGKMNFNDSFYHIRHQIYYGLSFGIIGFAAGFFIYYKRWQALAVGILAISVISLILVFTPLGLKASGATRWVNLGFMSFQPAEILKLSFILYLAAWLAKRKSGRRMNFVSEILPFLIIISVVGVLIIFQPATTTFVILLTASLIMFFVSGTKLRYLAMVGLLGILAIAVVVSITPYRFERITSFFNGSQDTLKSGYHLNQALMAIGSGGIYGHGFGQSTLKYKFLPEPIGDSIFAVIAEELGFAGSIFVIALFILIFLRGLSIAKNSGDNFGKFLAVGFSSIIAIQALVNIGAISGVLPLTGVPLPFISYGGTALAVFLTMSGIIANISRYT